MANVTFNTAEGQTINRELLILYLNTGTAAAPSWNAIGKRVEDSSLDIDFGSETKTDVLGHTYTTFQKPILTQSFDPCELDASDPAQVMLWNLAVKEQDYAALANLDLLLVHFYAGSASAPFAERYPASAIAPTSLGGSGGGSIGMPIDVTFGGERTTGTAAMDSDSGNITYTAA